MNVDYSDLTLGEIETIEELTGKTLDDIIEVKTPRGRLMRALVFVITKRGNPSYTFEETGKLTLEQGLTALGTGEDNDPKE
jgi:hypothetical protein